VSTLEERELLQQALDSLCRWAEEWGMEFNIKKCKVMHVGFNNPGHTYTMNNQQLEVTVEERDIGVCVTKSLKPSQQCAQAARSAQTVLSQISRAFHYRHRHIFKSLYVQYVKPHLEYAAVSWSPWLETDKAVIEKIQKRAVSMCRPEGKNLRGEITGTGTHNNGRATTSSRYDPDFQDYPWH
jgi:ribonuclease P/MRP protein subunit RPP40